MRGTDIDMRRSDRAVDRAAAMALLAKGEHGVLSTADASGQPYGVPLNYVLRGESIYFHCAQEGHKLLNLAHNPNAAFCVVGRTKLLRSKFSTEYESAIVFGTVVQVDGDERRQALMSLVEKYSPEHLDEGRSYVDRQADGTTVLRLDIARVTGKARA